MSASAATTRESTPTGAFAALANKVFARYLMVLTMSLAGNWIRITAMGYLVYDLTGDPFKLGLISFAQAAPQLLLSPLAGAVVDRVNRRKVLVAVQAALISMMTLLTWLVFTERVTYEWLLGIAIVVGAATTFDWPARLSIVPAMVSRKELPSAVALNAAAFNGARVVGPSVAGFLIAWLGMAAAFGITTISALPFLVVLFTIAAFRPSGTGAVAKPTEPPLRALIDGYRYIWHHRELRAMLSVDVVPIILGMSYSAMAPAIAADVLG
ncbi:MAG TPA: MFS transporter, partial [Thermomicrobiales bacterium]|nr:MFS transporter [Thermomicrobiales bacterium]